MSDTPKTDNKLLAHDELLRRHVETGAVLSVLELQRWFFDEHQRRPSITTLTKVQRAFRESLKTPDPKTKKIRAVEEAFAHVIAPYVEEAAEAKRGEQEALQAADAVVAHAEQQILAAQQRCDLLLADVAKRADDADLMRKAAWEATEKALGSLTGQLDAANAELMSLAVRAATVEAERDGALAEAINLRRRLEDALALNTRNVEAHAEELKAERVRSDVREARAAEQMSETTKHWGAQVTALRSEASELARKLDAAERALLADKANHEKALTRARHESINAVSDEIKRLSDALGGVNALFNTHVGSVRSQVEALTEAVLSLVQRIDAKAIQLPEALQSPRGDAAKK